MTEKEAFEATEKHETRETTLAEMGETLRFKRLDLSISLHDVEQALNIQVSYLKALESGDWSIMPGDVYALGFLRQYAKYLACDLNEQIQQLKANDYTLSQPLTYPDPPIAPNRKWMLFSALLFLILFIVFNIFNQQKSTPLPSQVMQHHAENIIKTEKVVHTAAQTEEVLPAKNATPASSEVKPSPTKEPSHTPELQLESNPTKNNTTKEASHTASTAPTHSTNAAVAPVTAGEHNYLFTAASDDVWLQVFTDAETPVLLRQDLLKKGTSMTVSSDKTLSITCGNPLALAIHIDDQLVVEAGKLAKSNRVLRHYILEIPSHP